VAVAVAPAVDTSSSRGRCRGLQTDEDLAHELLCTSRGPVPVAIAVAPAATETAA
jgi:hypothetical protein